MFDYRPMKRTDTDFQRPVGRGQIDRICSRAFGADHHVVAVRELPGGMFNSTFALEFENQSRFALRIAPDDHDAPFAHEAFLLRRDHAVQPYLAPIAHLIPSMIMADFTGQIIERDYMVQTFLPGELWHDVRNDLSEDANRSLWHQLGQIASEIHATTGTSFGFPAYGVRHARWSDAVIQIMQMELNDLAKYEINASGVERYIELLDLGRHHLDQIDVPRLLHGDLWPKNVLIERTNDDAIIVGLLDAERAFWGDPLAEWIYYFFDIPETYWQGIGGRPDGPSVRFRQQAYLAFYSVQSLLEAWRYHWNPSRLHGNIDQANTTMSQLL